MQTTNVVANQYTIYSTEHYYDSLVGGVERTGPGDRVLIVTMAFDSRAVRTKKLLNALSEAAHRGASVRLIVDAMPFLLYGGYKLGPLFYGSKLEPGMRPPFRDFYRELERLKRVGIDYVITNLPSRRFTLPIAGRSHIKFAVINDYLYIGGCNLDSIFKTDIDLMVGWENAKSAMQLYELGQRVATTQHMGEALGGGDVKWHLDGQAELLIDAGKVNRSVIFEAAMQLIDEARDYVFITCQYFPGQITGRHLLAAEKRGVRVCIVYGNSSQHEWPNNYLHVVVNAFERLRLPKAFFKHSLHHPEQRLHAKLIATEQGAMIGSHNYVTAGVMLGTAELALLNKDTTFSRAAIRSILSQLGRQADDIRHDLQGVI